MFPAAWSRLASSAPGDDRRGEQGYNIFAVPNDDPRFDDIKTLDEMQSRTSRDRAVLVAFKRLEGRAAERSRLVRLEDTHEIIRNSAVKVFAERLALSAKLRYHDQLSLRT